MTTNAALSVDIKSFRTATEYLNKIYEQRKKNDPGFSYEVWSVELGYKSRSFLKMIVSGQRKITPEFITNFCSRQSLTETDANYFTLIVNHEQAGSEKEKEIYLEKVIEHIGKNKKFAAIENHDLFLSSPHIPKILTLLSFVDIEKTTVSIAQMLNVDFADVEKYLGILSDLGLAKTGVDGISWEATDNSFRVANGFGNKALAEYHKMNMQEAIAAQHIEARLRRFGSLMVPLDDEDFQSFLKDLEQLISKAEAKYDHQRLDGKRIYKFNFCVYPATEKAQGQNQTSETQSRLSGEEFHA